MAHQPTRDEVLKAVQEACIYDSPNYEYDETAGKRVAASHTRKVIFPTKADIASRVATNNGAKVENQQYTSRASALRKHVSLSGVKKHLQDLASDGEIVVVTGDHWSVAGKYGTTRKATYFFSAEAVALLEAERIEKHRRSVAANARKFAEEKVLAKYHMEVDAIAEEFVHGEPSLPQQDLWPTPQQATLYLS